MREKINWTWKRIVGTILGILGIGTLTSCYGVPEDEFYYDIYGKVTGNINGTEKPIEDICVELYKNGKFNKAIHTDSDGWYEFRELEGTTYMVRFSDTDGAENGSFKTKVIDITLTDDFHKNITLENAD